MRLTKTGSWQLLRSCEKIAALMALHGAKGAVLFREREQPPFDPPRERPALAVSGLKGCGAWGIEVPAVAALLRSPPPQATDRAARAALQVPDCQCGGRGGLPSPFSGVFKRGILFGKRIPLLAWQPRSALHYKPARSAENALPPCSAAQIKKSRPFGQPPFIPLRGTRPAA